MSLATAAMGMLTDRWRDRVCTKCSASFVQWEISPAWNAIVKAMPQHTQDAWYRAVPDNALPLYCVPCERKDLGSSNPAPNKPYFSDR